MSREIDSFDEFHEQEMLGMRIRALAIYLENCASEYDPEYAYNPNQPELTLTDSCEAIQSKTEIGGELTTKLWFEATRKRSEISTGTQGKIEHVEYELTGTVRHRLPGYASLPDDIRYEVEEYIGPERECVAGDDARLDLMFEHYVIVDTDGKLVHDYGMYLAIKNGPTIPLPEYKMLVTSEERDGEDDVDDEYEADDEAESPTISDEVFEKLFSREEIAMLGLAAAAAEASLEKDKIKTEEIFNQFYELLYTVQTTPTFMWVDRAERMAQQIFHPEAENEEAA